MASNNSYKQSEAKKQKLEEIDVYFYSERDVIGEGFSSKVYRGMNSQTLEPVAIKVINKEILNEPINVALLQSELTILQEVKQCDHILHLHSIIRKEQDTYIITQMCQTDLSQIIVPPLPFQKIEDYIDQLLCGYQQIYRRQIIHRDLKPANLLIDNRGNLKIADFGFAMHAIQSRKQSKFNIGSPLYMSPQVLKSNQYSYKSDVWSIGVIIFEMLTGDNPWKAQNQLQLYQRYQQVRIQSILKRTKFPEHINKMLKKTLQFDRKFRISPQQLIKFRSAKPVIKDQKQQIKNQMPLQNNLKVEISPFIPRIKNTKTQKFYKTPNSVNSLNRYKTCTSIKDQQSGVKVTPINRCLNDNKKKDNNNSNNQENCEQQANTFVNAKKKQASIQKQNDKSQTTQTTTGIGNQGSQTNQPNNQNEKVVQALGKQESKKITKNLIYYIHICRLLYKIIVRMNQCLQNNFNKKVTQILDDHKQNLCRFYCHVIVKFMYKVKNFSNNNFLDLPKKHHQQYIMDHEYKKIRKVCSEYIQRYSKSDQLKYLWLQRQQPDYENTLQITTQVIKSLWPELCLRNQNQIILLEFILFGHEALQSLRRGSHEYIKDKERIQDFVDTIPNPPSFNRFKRAIAAAKKLCHQWICSTKQQSSQIQQCNN